MKNWLFTLLLALGTGATLHAQEANPVPLSATKPTQDDLKDLPIIRQLNPLCPVRLGGVFTMGLGDGGAWLDRSAPLSRANTRWIATHCDVIALPSVALTPTTFPTLNYVNPIFTPLLLVNGFTLSERADAAGNVGAWRPEMSAWTLKDVAGNEVTPPQPGSYWMDFGTADWAKFWRNGVLNDAKKYAAQGVVVTDLPLGNPGVGEQSARYGTLALQGEAQLEWLRAVRSPGRFLMVPSAQGFEAIVGKPTQPPLPGDAQPDLVGRYWDHFYPYVDGAWCEGWLQSYWQNDFFPENVREIQLQAADRTARSGNIFIAAAAYENDEQLEFLLANYLMVAHKQGRFVFQPMPKLPFAPADAGSSLKVFQNEVKRHEKLFFAPLGPPTQERHLIDATIDPTLPSKVQARNVWRRAFTYGAVYLNSDDNRSATLVFGTPMRRPTGERVTRLVLPPCTGMILLSEPERETTETIVKIPKNKISEKKD